MDRADSRNDKLNHLEENLGALRIELPPADVAEIEEGFASIGVQGARTRADLLERSDIGARMGTSSAGGTACLRCLEGAASSRAISIDIQRCGFLWRASRSGGSAGSE